MSAPLAATPVTFTPLQAAWAIFCARVHCNQPRDLRALNSGAALSGRICDIDALILAAKDMITAVVEDTAPHLNVNPAELVRTIDAHMDDMAGDIRGALLDAHHGRAA